MPSKPTHANASVHVSSYPDGGTTYPTKNGSKTIIAPQSAVGSPSIHNSDHLEGLERKTRAKMGHATENFAPASKGHLPEPRADAADTAPVAGTVNRKKQKRRQKQAAKEAAEKAHTGGRAQVAIHENGQARNRRIPPNSFSVPDDPAYAEDDFDDPVDFEGDGLYYSDEDGRLVYGNPYGQGDLPANGHGQTYDPPGTLAGKKSKKRRREKLHQGLRPHLAPDQSPLSPAPSATQAPPPPPPPPPLSATSPRPTHTISRDRIWNTSTQEERERIKEFWLSLSEEERRSLVKVEKEAVLRKMKEQQKHSCSCTVCGRKRTAIEEELEVLYDAYYEELEQYANHQQSNPNSGAPIMSPPRGYDHLSHMDPSRQFPPGIGDDGPPKGRVEELPDDEEEEEEDDDDDEDFSDDVEEEDDEEYSDEDLEPENRGPAADFFNFGNSLTVQGGILTVADDLLKNDGKKFIEMMEQLAERRMQREEEAQTAAAAYAHPSLNLPGHHAHAGHNHPPLPEEEEYDEEEEDEEYDSQDDEYDDEEMDAMTGEQRMEEGRRMFQIFAARMFEQRVLTAYREKVAQERQKKLLEELEEESRLDVQREQKKAKEAQKKKDKRRQQKQAKDEERARKEGEKAAEEAAARAVEEQKTEELRLKKEELRRKKEAERKAQEDERLRKEAEKHKKLQEERERQAEQERKHREQKERERKKREEAKREREEYEAREREFKERKAREEKERKAKDAKIRAEREARERARKQEMLAAARQAVAPAPPLVTTKSNKRPAHPAPPPPPVAPALASPPKALPSPHPPIATPAIPKAPSSARPAQAAHPESGQSSPPTPQALSRKGPSVSPSNVSRRSSPGPVGAPPRKASLPPVLLHHAPAAMTSALPSVPISVAPSVVPGVPPSVASVLGVPAMTQAGMPIVPGSISNGTIAAQQSPTRPTFHFGPLGNEGAGHGPPLPPIGSQLRTLPPVAIAPSPSLMGPPASAGRGLFIDSTLGLASDRGRQLPVGAAVGLGTGLPRDTMPTHTHSRHQSASMDEPSTAMFPLTQPIARPNPIQRPASAARQRAEENIRPLQSAVDDLSNHLGSSALMGDNDESFPPDGGFNRRASAVPVSQAAPGPPPPRSRYSFASMYQPGNQVKVDPIGPTTAVGAGHHPWGLPQMPFGVPSMARTSTWSQSPNVGWSSGNNAFGIIGSPIGRPSLSRPVNVRLMIVQACKELTASNQAGAGQHPQHHSHPHLHRPEGDLHDVNVVLSHVEQIQPMIEAPVTMKELLEMCETEGDGQNGGGYFTLTTDPATGYTFVRHEAGGTVSRSARGSVAPPGDIGSPVPGSSMPMTSFGGGGGGGGGGGVIGSGSGGGGGGGGSVVGVGPLGPLPSSIVSPSVGF